MYFLTVNLQYLQKNLLFIKTLSATERIFLLASIFLGWGFLHFDSQNIVRFARIGIDFGSVRLYITEIYILLLLALNLYHHRQAKKVVFSPATGRNPLFLLVVAFLAVGIFRLLPDFLSAPLLVIRNASFVWYLSISLLVYFLPLRIEIFDFYFRLIIGLGFFYFSIFILAFFIGAPNIYWIPFVGVYAPLAFSLLTDSWLWAILCLLPIACGLGIGLWQGFQRTSLLGMFAIIFAVILMNRSRLYFIIKRLLIFLLLFLTFAIILQKKNNKTADTFSINPLIKSETNRVGVEIFRGQMWIDAKNLFLKNYLWGIGFKKQVVYRIYQGAGHFSPNDGLSHQDANGSPIAGPHNSYLNAMARMGILGSIVFLIHCLAFWHLWFARATPALFLLAAQMLYACFNVGLEGPVRSFFLLLCLGLAMKFEREKNVA